MYLSLFSLSKNWMHNVVWGCAEILPQTYLNREGSGIGTSKLQGTFSLMRISDADALKLLSFSVPSVISIHFSVFLGYIWMCQHTRKVIRPWPATVFLWSDIWHGTQMFFRLKKIGSLRLHVPSDMKNSIILNDYMIQQQQETLLWIKYQL